MTKVSGFATMVYKIGNAEIGQVYTGQSIRFDDEKEAALAYDNAVKYMQAFLLNFPEVE